MLAHPGLRSLAGSDSETSVPSPWPPRSVPCNPLAAVLTQEYFMYICAFSWELAHYNELNKMLINTKNTAWLQILLECLLRGGLSRWLCGKDPSCQGRRHERCGFNPWVRKIPWSRKWQPGPVFLHGESHGQRSLVGYSPWSRKELDMSG